MTNCSHKKSDWALLPERQLEDRLPECYQVRGDDLPLRENSQRILFSRVSQSHRTDNGSRLRRRELKTSLFVVPALGRLPASECVLKCRAGASWVDAFSLRRSTDEQTRAQSETSTSGRLISFFHQRHLHPYFLLFFMYI